MKLRHILLAVAAVIIVIPVAAVAVLLAEFDPNSYAPSIIADVDQATGRQLAFGGPIQLRLSLTPTVQVSGVSLSNPPGFSDPNLLTLNNVQRRSRYCRCWPIRWISRNWF